MNVKKVTVVGGILLLLNGLVYAQQSAVTAKLAWTHDGKYLTGFKLYKGASPNSLSEVVNIANASARSFSYSVTDPLPVCFGLSAYGQGGESSITTKDGSGADVCLGKPLPPNSFSLSVP